MFHGISSIGQASTASTLEFGDAPGWDSQWGFSLLCGESIFGLCGFLDGGSNDRITGCFFFRKNVKTGRGSQLWRRENHRSKWWSFQHGMFDCRREKYIWLQCNYFCFWNLVATKTSNPNFRCLKMGK